MLRSGALYSCPLTSYTGDCTQVRTVHLYTCTHVHMYTCTPVHVLHDEHCTLHKEHCTEYTLYTTHSILHTAHCTLYTAHYTLQVVTDGLRRGDGQYDGRVGRSEEDLLPPLTQEIKEDQWLGVAVSSQGEGGGGRKSVRGWGE